MREKIPLTQPELAAKQMLWERQRYRPDPILAQRARGAEKKERKRKRAEWFRKAWEAKKKGEPPPAAE